MNVRTRLHCYYCGKELWLHSKPPARRDWIICERVRRKMTIDHAVPLARGGTDDSANSIQSCHACNSRKSALTMEEYRFYCRINKRDFNFHFYGDPDATQTHRDWLAVFSYDTKKMLFCHNNPIAYIAYSRARIERVL